MNSPQNSKSSRNLRLAIRLSLTALVVVCLLAAYIVPRALHGHGHWHQIAKTIEREIKGNPAEAAVLVTERADDPEIIYSDSLGDGWQDWSWGTRDLKYAVNVHSGQAAIVLRPVGNRGIYLHHDPFGIGGYGTLEVYVWGDTTAKVCAIGTDLKFLPQVPLSKYLRPDPAGRSGWHRVDIPLKELGATGGFTMTGLAFQPAMDSNTTLVLDDISLLPDMTLPPAPTAASVAITVNAAAGRHPISPYIYGMAFAPPDYIADLKVPLNRWGGNDKSRYNWVQGNADNAARDWGFRNRYASDGSVPPGPSSAADRFVRDDKAGGSATLLTVPTIGWVAKDYDNNHLSVNVPWTGGAGLNGADGAIAGYDPAANREITSVRSLPRKNAPFVNAPSPTSTIVYQDEWIAHLMHTFGDGAHGGVQFYAMDNEPDLWAATHTDVHPARMGYDDMLKNFLDYSNAVKDVDPTAMITGPVSWGWPGYIDSALDQGNDSFATHADRTAHGGVLFLPWFLNQVHNHDIKSGRRSLDILDVHLYPQANGVYGGQTDKETKALRLRSTRSLWDPSYKDESWIATPIYLIPRLQGWIDANYPGTRIGITEWNFGADKQINGGLAIADVLGIFGRENLYLANYWAYPDKNGPGYLAFKLFRNADGMGHGFGDIACSASSIDQDKLSCYAALDSHTGDLTMIVINKMSKATVTAPVEYQGFIPAGTVKMWRCSADNSRVLTAFPTRALKRVLTFPPQSMTLLRIPPKK